MVRGSNKSLFGVTTPGFCLLMAELFYFEINLNVLTGSFLQKNKTTFQICLFSVSLLDFTLMVEAAT